MEYFLNEDQKMVQSLARRIAEEKILPVRAELDETEEFPWDIVNELAVSDMFRVFIPEEYEGLGGGCLDLCLVIEELSRVCAGVALAYAVTSLGSFAIIVYGTEEQKKKYLPDIAAGKRLPTARPNWWERPARAHHRTCGRVDRRRAAPDPLLRNRS